MGMRSCARTFTLLPPCAFEAPNIHLSHVWPHHFAADTVCVLAYRLAPVFVRQEDIDCPRDGAGVTERHKYSTIISQEFGRMPVWCRHYCFSRPKSVGKCTARNLLLFEIRGNINISRADELGEFLQLDELVKEDDVALDPVFADKPLETETICFAMIAKEIGMRGAENNIDDIWKFGDDLWKRVENVFNSLIGRKQSKR